MNPETKAEFEKLLSQSSNKTCIDCDSYNPQWASVSNGVFMCIKCAGVHRSLGVHITFVRSVTMDTWSKIQLARMKNGGNAKMKKFWKSQKFPSKLSHKEKYDNEAMEKYRENLLSIAKGNDVKLIEYIGYKPRPMSNVSKSNSMSNLNNQHNRPQTNSSYQSKSHSSLKYNNNNNSSNSYQSGGFGNYDPSNDNNNNNDDMSNNAKDLFDGLSSWTSNFVAKSSVVASEFAAKSKEAASKISEKAALQANEIKSKVNDPNFQSKLKDSANQGWSNVSNWFSNASSKVSTIYNEAVNEMDDPVSLYNKDEMDPNRAQNDKYKQSAYSSDQWFEAHPSKYKNNAISSDSYFNDNNNNDDSNNNETNNQNDSNNSKSKLTNNNNDNSIKSKPSSYGTSYGTSNNDNNNNNLESEPKPKPKQKISNKDDKLDDWGFGGDSDNDDENDNNDSNNDNENDNDKDSDNSDNNIIKNENDNNKDSNELNEGASIMDNIANNNDVNKNEPKKQIKIQKSNEIGEDDDEWGW